MTATWDGRGREGRSPCQLRIPDHHIHMMHYFFTTPMSTTRELRAFNALPQCYFMAPQSVFVKIWSTLSSYWGSTRHAEAERPTGRLAFHSVYLHMVRHFLQAPWQSHVETRAADTLIETLCMAPQIVFVNIWTP